jgi:hypothetical protein
MTTNTELIDLRKEESLATAFALFANTKLLVGDHQAFKAAFDSVWSSAFSDGFQTQTKQTEALALAAQKGGV